jgi:hypothetical protein
VGGDLIPANTVHWRQKKELSRLNIGKRVFCIIPPPIATGPALSLYHDRGRLVVAPASKEGAKP